jgi:copper ion binding protein
MLAHLLRRTCALSGKKYFACPSLCVIILLHGRGHQREEQDSVPNVTITIPVQGMSCQHCVRSIERGLSKVPGILSVKVDLLRKVAAISFDDRAITEREVKAKLRELGFEVA